MKILLAGEGGQGIQLAAEILSYTGFLEGKDSSFIPNFGVEQRGGISLAFIVIGDEAGYPKFEKADVLAIMCSRACTRVKGYISDKTKIIYGPESGTKEDLKTELPARVWNSLVLGKIVAFTNVVSKESLIKSMKEKLEEKFAENPTIESLNMEALNEGFQS